MTDLLTVEEAAKALETSVQQLIHIIDVGDLRPSIRPHSDADAIWSKNTLDAIRFTPGDLENFRTDIHRRNFLDFKIRYADIFEPDEGPGSRGLEFGPGWTGILEEFCDRLRTLRAGVSPIRLRWGKEKFGCLKLFTDCDRLDASTLNLYWLDRARERARRLSLRTCEQCGAPARLRWGSHLATLCDRHAHIVGGLRAEDREIFDPQRKYVDGREVLREGEWSDAELGLRDGKTWDYRMQFALDFNPLLYPGAHIEDDDALIAELRDKLIAVDEAIGRYKEIIFRLTRYDRQKVEYDIRVDPRTHETASPLIDEDRMKSIKSEIDRIMRGDRQ